MTVSVISVSVFISDCGSLQQRELAQIWATLAAGVESLVLDTLIGQQPAARQLLRSVGPQTDNKDMKKKVE